MGRSLIHHDERSRSFPMRTVLDTTALRDRVWRRGYAYDQGSTPHCVAYTFKGKLNTAPWSGAIPYQVRSRYSTDEFYVGAQTNDQWPGESYDGTSALGACRYLKTRGVISEYRWCFSVAEILATLANFGPVALGVWWYEGMFWPDADGVIAPTGYQAGGHEVELIGVDVARRQVVGMNSWSDAWGDRGRFRLSWDSLERLMAEDGDAAVVVA